MKKLLFFLPLIFFILGLTVGTKLSLNNQKLEKEKTECLSELNKTKKIFDHYNNLSNFYLNAQRNKATEKNNQEIKTFFSFNKINQDERIIIDILLKADQEREIDGADLVLTFNPKLIKVIEMIDGEAFPFYPRKIINYDSLVITGLAKLENNKITLGKSNKRFIRLVIKKLSNEKTSIDFNSRESQIFFNEKNIFDQNLSFKKIEI